MDREHVEEVVEAASPVGPGSRLEVVDFAELVRQVDAAGPRSWLIEPLWPGDAYGVMGAEDKAGKTWAGLDLGASVVTGTPWLNHFECDSGPVLAFLGEGGRHNIVRRLDAICRGRGAERGDLDELRVAPAVPRLKSDEDLQVVRKEIETHSPRLVILDPFYLAAAGAKGSDLYAMGELLYGIQEICQAGGAALVVTTHWNKTGEGSGPQRFTGVGPGAWGRVLGSAAVERRAKDPDGASNVLLRWEFTGGEIPETVFRVRRRVWAEAPAFVDSRLHYDVEVTEEDVDPPRETDGLSRAQRRVLAALVGEEEPGIGVRDIGDRLAEDGQGPPLKARTIQQALKDLAQLGLADGEQEEGLPGRWWST
jgi:AAA domain